MEASPPCLRFLRSPAGLALVLSLIGCSQGHSGTPSGAHTSFPQVIYRGGGVLAAPNIITVTFPGDSMAAELQSFGQSVASSSWWATELAGYCEVPGGGTCVGKGRAGTAVAMTTPPDASYTDSVSGGPSSLQSWLTSAITSGKLPMPDKNPVTNTIYTLYFPPTTTITLDGTQSCSDTGFDGYHNSMAMGSQQVVYTVIVECDPLPAPFPSVKRVSLLQATTMTASHEIVEAATDPNSDPTAPYGYYLDYTDENNWGWIDVAGGEIADLCLDLFNMNQDQTTEGAFTVQRMWSNAQAAKGLDPCNPAPSGEAYFTAAPRQLVLVVGVGAQATLEVDAFSNAPAPPWTLSAQDWSNSPMPYLTFSIAGGTQTSSGPQIKVTSGSTVQITVTLTQDPGSLSTGEADGVIVSMSGDPSNPTAAHYWPFVVLSPADAKDAGIAATGSPSHRPGRLRRVHERQRLHVRP